jgi:hypothetical protein
MDTVDTSSASQDAPRGAFVPDLADYSGLLGVEVGGKIVQNLRVKRGHIELIAPSDQPTDAVFVFRNADDASKVLRGEINAVVAGIQGRFAARGNLVIGAKVIRGLQADLRAASSGHASSEKGA